MVISQFGCCMGCVLSWVGLVKFMENADEVLASGWRVAFFFFAWLWGGGYLLWFLLKVTPWLSQ